MKKYGILLLILVIFITGCSFKDMFVKENEKEELLNGTVLASINVKDYGTIKFELDADTAPITVTNFVNLVKNKFYDGLTFHRIMDGFMIQGGDPDGNGTGGSEKKIKGEFASNDFSNVCKMSLKNMKGFIHLHYKSHDYYIYLRHQDGMYYMTDAKTKCPFSYDLYRENDQKRFFNELYFTLRNACIDNNMKFKTYSMYDLIINYKKFFNV